MVKLVHFADTHLGIERYGHVDPHTGLPVRLLDFLKSMDQIVDTALGEEADLVVFAGDAYQSRTPSPTYQREFARRIVRLSRAGIPVVLVTGNHDVSGTAHTLEVFETFDVENVYVSSKPEVFDIETRHGPVQVGTLPWISRSGLLARGESRSIEEIDELIRERIETIFYGDEGLVSHLDPELPHVLVSHCTVQGSVYGSERSVSLGREIVMPLWLLKSKHSARTPLRQWDYVALGHIHKHQSIEPQRSPPVVYAGSVERNDFGEEHEDKGFVVAEVDAHGVRRRCSWEFRKLDVRPFVTIRVTVTESDPTAQIVGEIERMPLGQAIVRVVIQTTKERKASVHEEEVSRALRPAFHVASITYDVVRPARVYADAGDLTDVSPLDALEMYLKSKGTPPKRIELLKSRASEFFKDEGE